MPPCDLTQDWNHPILGEMYSITGRCGNTHIRIELRNMLELLAMKDRLEAEGWTIEGPLYLPE